MNIVVLSGSHLGSKTKTAMQAVYHSVKNEDPTANVAFLDLAKYSIPFSDGRNYLEYEGDALYVTETLMNADAIIIGTPIFQASIPGSLKNVFDLLPINAFRDKVISIVVTAGSAKHYLVAEQQIKPILAYMKAHLVQTYVFIEEKDFYRQEIINDDIHFRISRLVEDTILQTKVHQQIMVEKEMQYDF